MPQPPANLEPVTPNPRKLRNTALILVAVMIVGGWLILQAYERYTASRAADERPAMNSNRLTEEKDLPVVRQDGSRAGLFDLKGKVTVIQTVSVNDPESSARTNAVMRRVAEHFASQPDCVLVSLVLDPGSPEQATGSLVTASEKLGAKLPQWWVATTDPKILHKYVKKELKSSVFPLEQNGKWLHDTSIVLVDRTRHLRQPVVPQKRGGPAYVAPIDFDQAAAWDAKGIKSGTGRTNVEELELLLIKTIDELLAESVK